MYTNQSTVVGENATITRRNNVVIIHDFNTDLAIHFDGHTERLLVVAEQMHDSAIGVGEARQVAQGISETLTHSPWYHGTATLAEGDSPSMLLDTSDGRSFIVHVREV